MRVTSLCMLPLAPMARGGAEDGHLAQGRSVALGRQRVKRVIGADRQRATRIAVEGHRSLVEQGRRARSGALEVKHADAGEPGRRNTVPSWRAPSARAEH